jgi:hypothetical protein
MWLKGRVHERAAWQHTIDGNPKHVIGHRLVVEHAALGMSDKARGNIPKPAIKFG